MTPPAELFPASEVASESPRLRWLREHGLTLFEGSPELVGTESPETGEEYSAWYCVNMQDEKDERLDRYFGGSTADEACANYAAAHGLKLWNEEARK